MNIPSFLLSFSFDHLVAAIAYAYILAGLISIISFIKREWPSGFIHTAKEFILTALECPKCRAWWIALALTGSPITAALCSMLYAIYDRLSNQ